MYYEQTIKAASGGFGMYQAEPMNGDGYEYASDLEIEMHQGIGEHGGEMVELTDDAELPEWAEDIRGRIYDQPDRVFAVRVESGVYYTGITQR